MDKSDYLGRITVKTRASQSKIHQYTTIGHSFFNKKFNHIKINLFAQPLMNKIEQKTQQFYSETTLLIDSDSKYAMANKETGDMVTERKNLELINSKEMLEIIEALASDLNKFKIRGTLKFNNKRNLFEQMKFLYLRSGGSLRKLDAIVKNFKVDKRADKED